MRIDFAIAALFIGVVACGEDGPRTGPEPGIVLPDGIHALSGVDPASATGDLEPFDDVVADALFVALGESTHASRGYYQIKSRLIRHMVRDLGFRVLAWESPWLEAQVAASYVASCTGTPEAALGSLFPVWRDATVRDLLTWLCQWNQSHPNDKVTFFGFDIQEPWRSAPAVRAFLQAAAPSDAARADPLFRCLGASHTSMQWFATPEYQNHVAGQRNQSAHDDCLGGITAMESWVTANAATLTSASSAAEVERARLSLVALRAWEQQLWVPDPGGYQARDFGMSQMLLRLPTLLAPGKRVIVWAWNWHIARRYEEVKGWNGDSLEVVPRQGARAMGSFMHDALGADWLPIGIIGYNVATATGINPPIPPAELAVERRLNTLDWSYLFVDLRQPAADTLLSPGRNYQVSQEWGDPYRQFEALIFLEHSPAITIIATPPAIRR